MAVGLVGDHGGVQAQLVEGHQGQQHFDRAGGWVPHVLVPLGQYLAGIEIGDQPGLRRAVGDWYRANRLHTGVGSRRRTATDERQDSRDCGEECPHAR